MLAASKATFGQDLGAFRTNGQETVPVFSNYRATPRHKYLNDVLKQFEAVDANLGKLERLWKQIEVLLPSGREVGNCVCGRPTLRDLELQAPPRA